RLENNGIVKHAHEVIQPNKTRDTSQGTIVGKALIDGVQEWIDSNRQTPEHSRSNQNIGKHKQSCAASASSYSRRGCRNLRGSYIHSNPLFIQGTQSCQPRPLRKTFLVNV